LGVSSPALTDTGDLVLDPFVGIGSSIVASIMPCPAAACRVVR